MSKRAATLKFEKLKRKFEEEEFTPKLGTFEEVDLKTTAKTIKLEEKFDHIERVMFTVLQSDAIELSKFGNSLALDAFTFLYDATVYIPRTIRRFQDMISLCHNYETFADSAAVKQYSFSARFSFNRFSPGLKMGKGHKFEVEILSDLSAISDEILLTFEGWRYYYD
ncbi:MAG: hypothetical protein V3U02_10760 [Calditrichia bacterium]